MVDLLLFFFALTFIALAAAGVATLMKNRERKFRLQQEVETHVRPALESLDKANAAVRATTKRRHIELALASLSKVSDNPERHTLVPNFEEQVATLKSQSAVFPVIDHLDKAEKHAFKRKAAQEKNSLLDALHEIGLRRITDQDFERSGACVEATGEIPTVASIKARLRELGWDE